MPARYEHWTVDGVEIVRAANVDGATPWHSHVHLVVGRVDSGTRKIALRAGDITVRAGEGFVLPPYLAHRIVSCGATGYRVMCFPVTGCALARPCGAIAAADWCVLFERAFATAIAGHPDGLADLLQATLLAAPQAIASQGGPRAVRRLARDIAASPDRHQTLRGMARTVGLSPFYLQRLFVRSTGLSPRQARMVERLRHARAMLLAGATPAEAAAACGFADQSHLSREFRKWMGLPPGRYVAQLRPDPSP